MNRFEYLQDGEKERGEGREGRKRGEGEEGREREILHQYRTFSGSKRTFLNMASAALYLPCFR